MNKERQIERQIERQRERQRERVMMNKERERLKMKKDFLCKRKKKEWDKSVDEDEMKEDKELQILPVQRTKEWRELSRDNHHDKTGRKRD